MCGIVGVRRFDGRPIDEGQLREMTRLLTHRGPDSEGYSIYGSVGFGHRRLAIIDVAGSPQPMTSGNRPVHITYNGEIFNYQDLRNKLLEQNVSLTTHGDTEVLVELWAQKGPASLDMLNGQYSFGIYEADTDQLYIVRDRLGILPLYYTINESFFAFASESKALLPILKNGPEVNEKAVEEFLIYRSVPPNQTLFSNIYKLSPGKILQIDGARQVKENTYWSIPFGGAVEKHTSDDAKEKIQAGLEKAVERRLVADVPIGAYLSGGLDSSLIVALMKKLSPDGVVETFSAGFSDPRFDELPYARQVSKALNTRHHEVVVSPDDFIDYWQKLTWHRDSPISEPSDIAVYKIANIAQNNVKVLLSGEGADELFAGYPKYIWDKKLSWLHMKGLTSPLFQLIEGHLPPRLARQRIAMRVLAARSPAERIQAWFSPFTWYERKYLRNGYGNQQHLDQWIQSRGDHLNKMLYVDCHTWLSDNLLERGDRMSMAASVECRPPFLDHEFVQTAFNIDSSQKVKGSSGKWIIKEIARSLLPDTIVDRKKVGFRVPLDTWFKNDLREYSYDMLLSSGSFVNSYFDKKYIAKLLTNHKTERSNEDIRIWTLLGLEVWHQCFFKSQTRV